MFNMQYFVRKNWKNRVNDKNTKATVVICIRTFQSDVQCRCKRFVDILSVSTSPVDLNNAHRVEKLTTIVVPYVHVSSVARDIRSVHRRVICDG